MSIETVSEGETWAVRYLNRSYLGGPPVDVIRVNGDTAKGPLGQVQLASAPAVGGVTGLTITGFVHKTATGLSAAGPVTFTGVKVGDKVISATELTGTVGLDVTADFESKISVNAQIQQTSGNIVQTILFLVANLS